MRLWLLAALLLAGCAAQQPLAVEVPRGDFAAIAYFDCGELHSVMFITKAGEFQQITVTGGAMLMDLQLRMSQVPYDNVQYVQNTRPCAFVMDES